MIDPNRRIMTPSQEIDELARHIYFIKNGKHLLSYQTPPPSEFITAILTWLDDNHSPREVALLHPVVEEEKENDSQPTYRK